MSSRRKKEPEPKFVHTDKGLRILATDEFMDHIVESFKDDDLRKTCTNFTIVTDEGEIPCHQLIVATHSPVIKAMLALDTAKAQQKKVAISGFSHKILEILVKWMYTGDVDICREIMFELIVLTDYLQIEKLNDDLLYKVTRDEGYFTAETCLEWREMAEHLDLPELAMEVKKEIVASFFKLRTLDCFLQVDFIEIGRLMKEMEKDRIPKDYLLDATLRWLHHHANTDPIEWLSNGELKDFMTLIVDQWVIAPKESGILKAREYNTLSDRTGSWIHNQMKIYRYLQEQALENMEDKVR